MFFLSQIVLSRQCILIHHSQGNLVLHFHKSRVHRLGIHIAHNRLARDTIETDIVIGTILVLVVIKVALWHILELTLLVVHQHHLLVLLLALILIVKVIKLVAERMLVSLLFRVESHRLLLWML